MKQIKLIILILTIFVVTGCEVNYNLIINDTGMKESVDFLYDNNDENKKTLKNYLKNDYMAYYNMNNRQSNQYNKEEINNDDMIGMRLSYEYLTDDLKKSSLIDRCYYQKSVIRTKDEIVLSTDGKTKCFFQDGEQLIDKLVINIKTKLKVTDHNADKVDNNTYTWIINEDNYQNKPINMKIDLKNTQEKSFAWSIILIIAGVILIVILALLVHIHIKNKRNNKL